MGPVGGGVSVRGLRLKAGNPRTQLPVLVAQLPVGLRQPFEPFRHASGTKKRPGGTQAGDAGEEPLKRQQSEYLIERVATVSTACDNTPDSGHSPNSMSHKPKTVLVVDDDEGMRDTLTAILKRDYRVLRATSGEAALPLLNREDVDIVLLDVRLPGISGFEVQIGRAHV